MLGVFFYQSSQSLLAYPFLRLSEFAAVPCFYSLYLCGYRLSDKNVFLFTEWSWHRRGTHTCFAWTQLNLLKKPYIYSATHDNIDPDLFTFISKDLCIHIEELQREEDAERFPILWFTPQGTAIVRGQKSWAMKFISISQALVASVAAFPRLFAGSWIRSAEVRTWLTWDASIIGRDFICYITTPVPPTLF